MCGEYIGIYGSRNIGISAEKIGIGGHTTNVIDISATNVSIGNGSAKIDVCNNKISIGSQAATIGFFGKDSSGNGPPAVEYTSLSDLMDALLHLGLIKRK